MGLVESCGQWCIIQNGTLLFVLLLLRDPCMMYQKLVPYYLFIFHCSTKLSYYKHLKACVSNSMMGDSAFFSGIGEVFSCCCMKVSFSVVIGEYSPSPTHFLLHNTYEQSQVKIYNDKNFISSGPTLLQVVFFVALAHNLLLEILQEVLSELNDRLIT